MGYVKNLTAKNKKMEYLASKEIVDPTVAQNDLDKELTKCKFKAFGKIQFKDSNVKKIQSKDMDELFKLKEKLSSEDSSSESNQVAIEAVDSNIAKVLNMKQREKLDSE